ncbi:MAG: 1,2-phenylacetyl-CoA epoxidase subunit PaaD [Candidatus Dormibacteria bacterium]|jgi:ring-1,2-phenylacetyl-CoA epoxidase subunit PaaD
MPAGESSAWEVAAGVADPELPDLTLEDLGVLRSVDVGPDGEVAVVLTPTYSGCPALEVMRQDVIAALRSAGHQSVRVDFQLQPAWTTDLMGPRGRERLAEMRIAPPPPAGSGPLLQVSLKCPQCGSLRTRETSHFGSTSCKSLWRCLACGEPFEHFKALY